MTNGHRRLEHVVLLAVAWGAAHPAVAQLDDKVCDVDSSDAVTPCQRSLKALALSCSVVAARMIDASARASSEAFAPPAAASRESPRPHTPDLLDEAGYRYVLDWCMDDQPVWLKTRSGRILAVPVSAGTQ